jgi:hypothetical protein
MATPKEQYEARKRERQNRRDQANSNSEIRDYEMAEMVDRFVTAHELIAVSLELIAKGNSDAKR